MGSLVAEGSELAIVFLEIDEEVGISIKVVDEVLKGVGLETETQAHEAVKVVGGDEEVPRWQMKARQERNSRSLLKVPE